MNAETGCKKSGDGGLHVVVSTVYDNSNEDTRMQDSSGTKGRRF